MREAVVVVMLAALTGGCATKGAMKVGVGTGFGLIVAGAASGMTSEGSANATFDSTQVLMLGGVGLVALSLVTYGIASGFGAMHDANDRVRDAARSPQAELTPIVPAPVTAPRVIQVAPGTIIRAEGSVCTGKLDVCAAGLSCVDGTCRVPPQARD